MVAKRDPDAVRTSPRASQRPLRAVNESTAQVRRLRALSNPLRLRALSLLTGATMTCAEVARELDIAPGSAHWHLNQLHRAGLLTRFDAGENGAEPTYRHDPASAQNFPPPDEPLVQAALAAELTRRMQQMNLRHDAQIADAELWVDRETWEKALQAIGDAVHLLHERARPAHTPKTVHVSVTTALFRMR